jgi:HK97 family phage prohead protease
MTRPNRSQARFHYRTLGFQIRSVDEKDGSYFEGYCAVLNNIDEYGTIMGRGAFDRDIAYFRDNGFIGGLNHNWDSPLGTPNEKTMPDEHGLFVGANVIDTAHGQDVRKLLKARVIKKLSFGFEDLDKRWLDQREDVERYWDSVGYAPTDEDKERSKNGALLFTRLKVYEASPVMSAGNTSAGITAVRGRLRGDDDDSGDDDDNEMSVCQQDDGKWYVKKKGGKTARVKYEPADGFETKKEADELMAACKPRSFLDFETHSLSARDAVEEFCGRAEQLSALRLTQGRALAPERRAILRQIRDRADRALAACQPRASRSDVANLRRELIEIETSILRP